jgi:hypothetical protein
MGELTAWAYRVLIYPWNTDLPLITILLLGKKPGGDQPRPKVGSINFYPEDADLPEATVETGGSGEKTHVYHMPISMYDPILTTLREEGPSLLLQAAKDGGKPRRLSTDDEPIGESERK